MICIIVTETVKLVRCAPSFCQEEFAFNPVSLLHVSNVGMMAEISQDGLFHASRTISGDARRFAIQRKVLGLVIESV